TKGIFAPSLPTKYGSFREFLKDKRAEFSYGFDYSQKKLDKLADFLDEHSLIRVRRNVDAQRQDFTESLLLDLADPSSRLSRRLGLSESERENLSSIISRTHVSRDTLLMLAENLDQYRRAAFWEYIQALYYLIGGRWNNSDPLVHPRLIPVYKDKFARSLGAYEPRLFSSVLKGIGLRPDLLDELSIRDIIQLREESSVKEFRRKYFEVINEARKGVILSPEKTEFLQTVTLEEIVLDLIDRKLADEYKRINLHSKIKRIWSLSSFATTIISAGVSLMSSNPFAIGTTIISGAASIINTFTSLSDPLIDRLFRTSGTEFITFATQIIELEAQRLKDRTG
ncbi:MAG: hypothetical protein ACPLPV_09025, partial [Methanomassiliicoccales archaeon]